MKSVKPELLALQRLARILDTLPPDAQQRAIVWLQSQYAAEIKSDALAQVVGTRYGNGSAGRE